jgi:HK97 family phage major capsid protein
MANQLKIKYDRLVAARDQATAKRKAILDRAEKEGREELTVDESRAFRELSDVVLPELDRRCAEAHDDLARSGWDDPEVDAVRAAINGEGGKPTGPANNLAPLTFDPDALRRAHAAIEQRSTFRTEARAFSSADALLPPQLWPYVTGTVHENRLLSRLPVAPMETRSIEYIRHVSTTGAPAVTALGAAKPELVMNVDHIIVEASKIAAHVGVPFEDISDFNNFFMYVQGELGFQVVDVENDELLNGDGTGDHVTGLTHTSGILSHAVGTSETPLDAIESSIATLRTGPALATANLAILHPSTWSAVRRSKDSMGRYLTSADPTGPEANSVWGLPVLVTTQQPPGEGVLLDTTKFGRVHIRQPLVLLVGYANDDLTKNIVRLVAEERLALAVERPAAVLQITGLPTS